MLVVKNIIVTKEKAFIFICFFFLNKILCKIGRGLDLFFNKILCRCYLKLLLNIDNSIRIVWQHKLCFIFFSNFRNGVCNTEYCRKMTTPSSIRYSRKASSFVGCSVRLLVCWDFFRVYCINFLFVQSEL